MKILRSMVAGRLFDDRVAARVGSWACILSGIAIVPSAVVALEKHPGTRADFLVGIGLALVLGLLFLMLGLLTRHVDAMGRAVPPRSRRVEFAGYFACLGIMIVGLRGLPSLDLGPAEVTVGVLLTFTVALAVLVLGMMTTVIRSIRA